MGEWLIKEKRAKWHSAMPPSSLRVMYGSYYRADKYYKEMELFTNKIDRAIARGVSYRNLHSIVPQTKKPIEVGFILDEIGNLRVEWREVR